MIMYCVIKHLILPKIQNTMGINVGLLQWFIKFLIKNTSGGTVKNEIISNKELSEELHKTISKKLEEKKSTLTIYRRYLGRISSRYAIDKKI